MTMRNLHTPFVDVVLELVIASLLVVGMSATSWADTATTGEDSATVIHLHRYNSYFAADETLTSLTAGEFEFVATNRMERQNDNRYANDVLTSSDNDLFVGGRLALKDAQDTALPAGVVFDIDTTETIFNIETERRFGDNAVLELRARAINGADSGETAYAFGRDGYIQWRIVRNF